MNAAAAPRPSLVTLSLRSNYGLGDEGAEVLAGFLRSDAGRALRFLDASACGVGTAGGLAIAKALLPLPAAEAAVDHVDGGGPRGLVLALRDNKLDDACAFAFARVLDDGRRRPGQDGDDGLGREPVLARLDLAGNVAIGDAGYGALVRAGGGCQIHL